MGNRKEPSLFVNIFFRKKFGGGVRGGGLRFQERTLRFVENATKRWRNSVSFFFHPGVRKIEIERDEIPSKTFWIIPKNILIYSNEVTELHISAINLSSSFNFSQNFTVRGELWFQNSNRRLYEGCFRTNADLNLPSQNRKLNMNHAMNHLQNFRNFVHYQSSVNR